MSRSLTPATTALIITCLAEILPADRYQVTSGAGMGAYDGVCVYPLDQSDTAEPWEAYWYFDTTWGGEDDYTDHLRAYFTTAVGDCIDDATADGKPSIDEDPITIAQWIVGVVTGPRPCR